MMPSLNTVSDTYLSPEWITQALKYSGAINGDARAVESRAETLSGGLMADTYRIDLAYESPDDAGPKTLVAKFPSSNPDSRSAGEEMLAYEREINFYKYIRPTLSTRVPVCYFAEIDRDTGNFALLIEDLNPAEVVTGPNCGYRRAESAMRQLAHLHADTWGGMALTGGDWLLDYGDTAYFCQLQSWLEKGWGIMKQVAGDVGVDRSGTPIQLPDNFESLGDAFLEKLDDWQARITERRCLVHCDYRTANLLFKGPDESIAIDWQTFHLGSPGIDTSYFINCTFDQQQRQEHQGRLLDAYYETLQQREISDYSRENCWEDFLFGGFYCVMMTMYTTYGVGGTQLSAAARDQIFSTVPRFWAFISENNILDEL